MELSKIKGIGPKTEDLFNKIMIYNSDDLLRYFPYRYEVFKPTIIDTNSVDNQVIVGKIVSDVKISYIRKNFTMLTFQIIHNNIPIKVAIYNRHFLKTHLTFNKYITIVGKYNKFKNTFVASNIILYELKQTKVEPIYHTINGLKVKTIKDAINEALKSTDINEILPDEFNKKYELINTTDAIKEIHSPTSSTMLKKAQIKLKYEELFEFMFKVGILKFKNQIFDDYTIKNIEKNELNNILSHLQFKLTNDQLLAIDDIIKDFNDFKRMNRLILGDVGSGKTIVAFIALILNYKMGYQGALLSPTEVLANQHFNTLSDLAKVFNIKVSILTGSTKKKDADLIAKQLENNEIDIIIGTHSLLNDKILFNNIGLVITDEQHRFGVNQRLSLQKKGNCVDVLYMSATPIPRTYALTIYGDMDISTIHEKPSGRKDIITSLHKFDELNIIINKIQEEIDKHYQVYVVASLIEEDEESNLMDINEIESLLKKSLKENAKIGSMHGKMKQTLKDEVMNSFINQEINVLVSTTVIEVGVDIKNATLMVILNAERFGLASLHQLRGRVGRNDYQSYCMLVSDLDSKRLNVLCESNDGFYICEKDFELRGSGDLFGIRQSGDMAFKIANISKDYKILLQAKKDTEEFINNNIENSFRNYSYYKDILAKLTKID